MSNRQQRLTVLINEAARDLMPPGKGPLTEEERTEFGERLAESIRKMPDVHSVQFSPAVGTIQITRDAPILVRFPITITVDGDKS